MTLAEVRLWGRRIGAVSLESSDDVGSFEYDPEFRDSGIEVSPITMPLSDLIYRFPALPRETFHGLPGLLADSLPDRFGNALIDAWLATQGRAPNTFDAVERLCYVGSRGMGALEFAPAIALRAYTAKPIAIDALVAFASEVLTNRSNLQGRFHDEEIDQTMRDLLIVGTSAGGARAKAVIAWNPTTQEVRSGQVPAGEGFEYWLLKFDGVSGNRDRELEDPKGFGAIEYAYHLMARAADVTMTDCRLLEEGGRRHFMTRRFDRLAAGEKLHVQSLGALAHLDFNQAGAHGYEQAFLAARQLGLSTTVIEQQFRRMVFNVVGRNQDDHVKNIAFLMNKEGDWSLAPAFDLTWAFNPSGRWTSTHQMTVNGKRDDFTLSDLQASAHSGGLKRGRAAAIIDEVVAAVRRWPEFAAEARIGPDVAANIARTHRLVFDA